MAVTCEILISGNNQQADTKIILKILFNTIYV